MKVVKWDALPSISGAPSVQNTKFSSQQFYLVNNMFTLFKMFIAFLCSFQNILHLIFAWESISRLNTATVAAQASFLWEKYLSRSVKHPPMTQISGQAISISISISLFPLTWSFYRWISIKYSVYFYGLSKDIVRSIFRFCET